MLPINLCKIMSFYCKIFSFTAWRTAQKAQVRLRNFECKFMMSKRYPALKFLWKPPVWQIYMRLRELGSTLYINI